MSDSTQSKNNPKVSLVIRCYNEERNINQLLSGVMQQTMHDIEIIVVDSGSSDSTLSIVARYPAKILNIKPEDFSFGHSLNLGCQMARGDYIVIASAHVYPVYQDWLEKLLVPFTDPRIALVYGKQRGNEATKFAEHQIFAKWFPENTCMEQGHPFCNNANAAIRRSIWEQIPYDETLTGLEDIDWAKRAMALGYKIAYSAEAEIVHVHNETYTQIYNRYRREAIALKRIYTQEMFGFWDFIRLFSANLISDCYQAWRDKVLWKNLKEIAPFRLMQFWGTYQGFALHGPVSSELKHRFYYPNGIKRNTESEMPINSNRSPIKYKGG
jgi:glycosyltransferase involved in cell wall biosynthesis